ncbi:Alpha/Beta hydrolase protein [Neohortaea acidophila]|uniref:Alpha/Beta hydrolase protein n=1 Tax=Neohortaea acidophila TaxID=245834 RepID=A0A6A6PKZ5_9PEZI|nr:Alpha/Beta hydrolase protein [Neohortaea acidophila]KAF2480748.1 Alpha/Beta hydrolase protein [Neohortaea acidophila]
MPETKYFEHELTLSANSEPAGSKLAAKQAYWTFGDTSKPAVFLPTCYGGTLESTLPFLYSSEHSSDPILPPSQYFIIVAAMLGGGESSSPSNSGQGPDFPRTTYEDNIRLQHALCESLGIKKLFAYIGFSMGGQQAYHISTLFPDFVEHMVCIAGSARTSWHNWCFLEGPRYALIMSKDFQDGRYERNPEAGLKAFSRVYSTWALSPQWFRDRCWEQAGFKTLEEFLEANWSGNGDANDRLADLWTWQHGDITLYHPEDGGDLAKTLGRIRAKCLIMPSRTDQYFPPEDSEFEVKHLKHGEYRPIDSVWGHIAGSGFSGAKEDTEFMAKEIKRFLNV